MEARHRMARHSHAVVATLVVLIVATACSGIEPIDVVTEENFRTLITLEDDFEELLLRTQQINVDVRDTKALVSSADPNAVTDVEAWYTMSFESLDRNKQMLMSVIDFESGTGAIRHLETMRSNLPDFPIVAIDPPVGDESFEIQVNEVGVGVLLVFKKGDKAVTLHTAQPDGDEPLVSVEGLEELARSVERKLR